MLSNERGSPFTKSYSSWGGKSDGDKGSVSGQTLM